MDASPFLTHFAAALERGKRELAVIEDELRACSVSLSGTPDTLVELRHRRNRREAENKQLAADIDRIRWLAHGPEMKEVDQLLLNAFSEDEPAERTRKSEAFIHAAWLARFDYEPPRERLTRASALKNEIAKTAEHLAALLRQLGEADPWRPSELYSVDDALRVTENTERSAADGERWRALRRHVLGDRGRPRPTEVRILEPDESSAVDPVERARASVRYAWSAAPPVAALLNTLARVARDYEPSQDGFVGAALNRQRNNKMEYLRAFLHLLCRQYEVASTDDIKQAIAIAATLVLDVNVTVGDVSNAAKSLEKPD